MKRTLAFAAGAVALLGMTGLAVAQPAYGPNAAYDPDYGYGYAAPAYGPNAAYYSNYDYGYAAPTYGPNAAYYSDYADYGYAAPAYPPTAYAPPPVTYTQPYWDQTHMNDGASRAYSYWGAQKSN